MAITLALLLDDANARRVREETGVGLLLLERTLFEPPRAAACRRWGSQLRRVFPDAELAAYAWHLVSHGPNDGLRSMGTRTLPGDAARFGGLLETEEVAAAMEVMRTCLAALDTDRLVVRTPSSLAPGAVGRRRVDAFLRRATADGLRVVWEPQGLWSADEARAVAAPHGTDVLLPALAGGRPQWADEDRELLVAPSVWLRVDGVGPRRTLPGGAIDALLDHAQTQPDAVLVFAGPRAVANMRAFEQARG